MICPTHGNECALNRYRGWKPMDCARILDEGEVALRRRKGWPPITECGRAVLSVSRDSGYDLERPLLNDDYEAHKTHDQERWEKLRPGVPWPGAAVDLAVKGGEKVWKNYIPGVGPVIKNKRERAEYMRLTGHREIDKGERWGEVSPNARAAQALASRWKAFVTKG